MPFLKFRSIHNLSITFPKVPNLLYDTPFPFIIPLTHLFIIYICLMIPYDLSWSLRILYDPLQYSMTIQPLHDPYVIHMLSVCYVPTHISFLPCTSFPMLLTSYVFHYFPQASFPTLLYETMLFIDYLMVSSCLPSSSIYMSAR